MINKFIYYIKGEATTVICQNHEYFANFFNIFAMSGLNTWIVFVPDLHAVEIAFDLGLFGAISADLDIDISVKDVLFLL